MKTDKMVRLLGINFIIESIEGRSRSSRDIISTYGTKTHYETLHPISELFSINFNFQNDSICDSLIKIGEDGDKKITDAKQ